MTAAAQMIRTCPADLGMSTAAYARKQARN